MTNKNIVIDVHHHWMPQEHYLRPEPFTRWGEKVQWKAGRFRILRKGVQLFSPPPMTASMEDQIKSMDRAGVDQAALHVGVWLDWVNIKAARTINDAMAETSERHKGRIVPVAHVPPLAADSRKELKRAVVNLGFKAVAMNTHIKGILMDDQRLYPFYKVVSDLNIPILVHPAGELPMAHPHGMEQFNLTRNLGRAMDTTINMARLMLSGTLDRFPKLRFVFSHMGGAFFALKNRLNPSFWDNRAKGFFDRYQKRIFIDTAPPFWIPEEVHFAVQTMGEEQVLLGSDFPTVGSLGEAVKIIEKSRLAPQVKKKLLGDNARKLFR